MHIVNLTNQEQKQKTLKQIRVIQQQRRKLGKSSSSGKQIVITTIGGDGTFMYLAQDAHKEGLILDDGTIAFCILPFGTGNDLSQVLGWGKKPKDEWFKQLQSLAQSIINSHEESFNVWEIKTVLHNQETSN